MGLPVIVDGKAVKLSRRHQAFVDNLVSNGGNMEQAAIDAGFKPDNAKTYAYELLRKPHIMTAFQNQCALIMASNAPKAMQTLESLMVNGRSEYVKMQAAQDLLDRVGMRVSEKVDHSVGGELKVSIDLS